jgi:hypothetical protein
VRSKISDRLPTTRGIINSCLLLGEMAVKAVQGRPTRDVVDVVDEGRACIEKEMTMINNIMWLMSNDVCWMVVDT